jgi:hypothetical protein
MKKLLSIMLAALMLLGMIACTGTPAQPDQPEQPTDAPVQPTEAPAETTPEPEATTEYEGLALQLKNKTGLTIKALYISEKGVDLYAKKLNSVVEEGWQDKEVDPENYEKYIYIVREAGKEMEVTVVFEDETSVKWDVGTLAMYDELSLKKGADPANWEHEPAKDEDKMMLDFMVALGKTADNFYPGYELIPVELKNKTGKGIKEFYFYEEGGDPKAYNNMIDYLYTPAGEKMDVLMSGKAKEGGMYLFKCFIRPHTENYYIDVVFDDGATITYPIEGWFKPDGDGNLPNEISLKNAEDPDDIKIQYDDGVPEPIDYLAESLAKGYIVDQWYPTYTETTMDAETVAALRAGQAMIPVPAPEEPAEPTEPEPEKDASTENQIPAGYTIPEGYIGLALNVKNKTGKTINELYIYDMTEDPEVFLDYYAPIFENPWLDKDADGDNYEQNIYIIRKIADNYQLKVIYEDGTEMTADLGKLALYDKISLKGPTAEDVKHEPNDDPADIAAMDALIEAGVATDGHYTAVLADIPTGYTGLHLMLKNKSGKEIEKVYLFPTGEDKGKNIFKTVVDGLIPTEDESLAEKPHEVFAFVHRETAKLGAMTLRVRYADGTEEDYELAPVEDYTVFTIKDTPDGFKQKVADDQEDLAAMDAVMLRASGASTDGVTFDPIA